MGIGEKARPVEPFKLLNEFIDLPTITYTMLVDGKPETMNVRFRIYRVSADNLHPFLQTSFLVFSASSAPPALHLATPSTAQRFYFILSLVYVSM